MTFHESIFLWQFSMRLLGVFEVWSCCYVTRLVLEHTVWCSWTVQFFVMFDMFKVRFWAKMWCSESLMFGHSMFGVFEVRYFGVPSKTSFFDIYYVPVGPVNYNTFCLTLLKYEWLTIFCNFPKKGEPFNNGQLFLLIGGSGIEMEDITLDICQ